MEGIDNGKKRQHLRLALFKQGMGICGHCEQIKPLDQFYKNKCKYIKHSFVCKKCTPKISQEYLKTPQAKKTRSLWEKKRKLDLGYKLNRSVSASIWYALKKGQNKKGYYWEKHIGYTITKLKQHLESLFVSGMSWGNYGEWHIDHIKPRIEFNYKIIGDTEFKRCWDLSNLRPLWAEENKAKNI